MRFAARSSLKPPRAKLGCWLGVLSVPAIAIASWSALRRHMWREHTRQAHLRSEEISAERGRIARELHDTLAQNLAGLALQLEGTAQALSADSDSARDHLERARDLVHASLEASHRVVWDLRAANDLDGLSDALSRLGEPFAGVSRVAVTVAGRERPLPAEVGSHLLRIGQEAVTNAVRHGTAQNVGVELRYEEEHVLLLVEDDGTGFSIDDVPEGHFGLRGMKERARQMRGSLSIVSRPGAGTRIRLQVPLEDLS